MYTVQYIQLYYRMFDGRLSTRPRPLGCILCVYRAEGPIDGEETLRSRGSPTLNS